MTQPEPRHPTSDDEELLEAETLAILSEYTDAQRVLRIQDELREGFRQLNHVGKAVSIFGSARTPPEHPRYEQARALARHLGEQGYAIITGGGPGIMEAANRGAQDVGATSIGLGIELPHEQSLNDYCDIGINFHYFFTRKVMFVRYASGFVVFPGGFGTLDELFEAATLRQTQKIRYFPIVLFDSGYWSGLLDWLKHSMLADGYINATDVESLVVTDDPNDCHGALDVVEHRRPRNHPKAAGLGSHPVARTATQHDTLRLAAHMGGEDRLVLVGARLVDDLDEGQLLGVGPEALGDDLSRSSLQDRPIPATITRRSRDEILLHLRERTLERGAGAGELPVAGDDAAADQHGKDDQDDDEPEHESSMSALVQNGARIQVRPDLALDALQRVVHRLAVAAQPLADVRVGVAVEVEREHARLEV